LMTAWTKAAPDHFRAWNTRARTAFLALDHTDVIRAATRGLAIEEDPGLRAVRGISLLSRLDPEAALADFDALAGLPDVWTKLQDQVAPYRDKAKRATQALGAVHQLRDRLASGAATAQDLVRTWVPFPLGVIDLREAAAGQRRLVEDLEWDDVVTHSIG